MLKKMQPFLGTKKCYKEDEMFQPKNEDSLHAKKATIPF